MELEMLIIGLIMLIDLANCAPRTLMSQKGFHQDFDLSQKEHKPIDWSKINKLTFYASRPLNQGRNCFFSPVQCTFNTVEPVMDTVVGPGGPFSQQQSSKQPSNHISSQQSFRSSSAASSGLDFIQTFQLLQLLAPSTAKSSTPTSPKPTFVDRARFSPKKEFRTTTTPATPFLETSTSTTDRGGPLLVAKLMWQMNDFRF